MVRVLGGSVGGRSLKHLITRLEELRALGVPPQVHPRRTKKIASSLARMTM